ncbi:MAG: hypothetical protein ACREJO_12145 [Phycisphaerales bacterium]
MRTSTRHIVGGFAAGLFTAAAFAAMLGFHQQSSPPKIDPRIEALMRDIRGAEDALAEAETQVKFWQQEFVSQDTEVSRCQADAEGSPCMAFFLDRAKGLSNRAAHSALDARLRQALCARKVAALKADLAAP